ncbi:PREDICTED: translation initiation factor IF-2-like [Chinchilla lanigera]|uniref:translation initiation factor IF-2-like n=1 Tax=Chinchilla lanigera TaxID=34839 RepID=UPI000696B82A|nr:PREDICTED: translation initiation factor IF-2-like [Chinchilla lanigera]
MLTEIEFFDVYRVLWVLKFVDTDLEDHHLQIKYFTSIKLPLGLSVLFRLSCPPGAVELTAVGVPSRSRLASLFRRERAVQAPCHEPSVKEGVLGLKAMKHSCALLPCSKACALRVEAAQTVFLEFPSSLSAASENTAAALPAARSAASPRPGRPRSPRASPKPAPGRRRRLAAPPGVRARFPGSPEDGAPALRTEAASSTGGTVALSLCPLPVVFFSSGTRNRTHDPALAGHAAPLSYIPSPFPALSVRAPWLRSGTASPRACAVERPVVGRASRCLRVWLSPDFPRVESSAVSSVETGARPAPLLLFPLFALVQPQAGPWELAGSRMLRGPAAPTRRVSAGFLCPRPRPAPGARRPSSSPASGASLIWACAPAGVLRRPAGELYFSLWRDGRRWLWGLGAHLRFPATGCPSVLQAGPERRRPHWLLLTRF